MSWNAWRYQRGHIHEESASVGENTAHRTNDRALMMRILTTDNIAKVFGSPSVEYAHRVALRVKSAKKRDPGNMPTMGEKCRVFLRRRLSKRNNHHLSPRCRPDDAYHGTKPYNILLMKIERHNELHKEFGVRTWEEIIFVLWRCRTQITAIDFAELCASAATAIGLPRKRKYWRCCTIRDFEYHRGLEEIEALSFWIVAQYADEEMRKAEWFMLIILLAAVATGLFFYPQLPPVVASHWDASGNVNGYMAKGWAVATFPIIIAIMSLFFLLIPRIDPKRENIAKFRNYFDYLIIAISLVFYYFFLLFLFWNVGVPFNFIPAIIPAFSFLFWFIGMILPYTEPNWFIGIRTPWTISSETVWKKTHIVGGMWFKISALIALLGIVFPSVALWLMLVPILATAIGVFVYSYVLYEKEIKHRAL